MINRYTLLLSLLVIGCSKDYIEEEVYLSNSTPTLEVQTVTPTAVVPETITYYTLSERYSSINETTGYLNLKRSLLSIYQKISLMITLPFILMVIMLFIKPSIKILLY